VDLHELLAFGAADAEQSSDRGERVGLVLRCGHRGHAQFAHLLRLAHQRVDHRQSHQPVLDECGNNVGHAQPGHQPHLHASSRRQRRLHCEHHRQPLLEEHRLQKRAKVPIHGRCGHHPSPKDDQAQHVPGFAHTQERRVLLILRHLDGVPGLDFALEDEDDPGQVAGPVRECEREVRADLHAQFELVLAALEPLAGLLAQEFARPVGAGRLLDLVQPVCDGHARGALDAEPH